MIILELAVLVFLLMLIGIFLTAKEFNRMLDDDEKNDDSKD